MSTLIHRAHALIFIEPDPHRRYILTGAALVFEAACAMDDDQPDKAGRVAIAWGRLKALVEGMHDAD